MWFCISQKLNHVKTCHWLFTGIYFFNLRHFTVKICVLIHVSFLKYYMWTFKLHSHVVWTRVLKIKYVFAMKNYNLTLQVTELESKVSKCQTMLESQMKNMDADSGEKNRLKEEVRKTRSPTDCVCRMLS